MDCMGNLIGTLPGTEPELAPVWTGSHFDTVLHGGRFDGVAGVVAGMEALKLIADSGAAHRRNLACVAYAAEEPARFGIGCIGSRAMAGALSVQDLKTTRALDGPSLYDELRARELAADDIESCRKKPGDVFCAVELHIEQNSVLETSGGAPWGCKGHLRGAEFYGDGYGHSGARRWDADGEPAGCLRSGK